jgi:hypothetical protein
MALTWIRSALKSNAKKRKRLGWPIIFKEW